jgi:hypothetical protein
MWGQVAMLAAQLIGSQQAKKRQEELARQQMVEKMLAQRAAQLGGNTMPIEAAAFNRDMDLQRKQSVISPMDLVKMYGAFNYDDDKAKAPEREYPEMTDLDWSDAAQSRNEALEATSTPDWQGLNPEDDPEFRRKHGLYR